MASIAIMVGGAIINAAAFSGGNYLFSMLNKKDADEERVRHDKALEDFQQAQAAYARKRQEHLDYLNDRLRAEGHAEKVYENVDAAMQRYYEVTGNKVDAPPQPEMSDYYSPSPEQQKNEITFVLSGLAALGFTVFKFL
jgi:hypothetical protein